MHPYASPVTFSLLPCGNAARMDQSTLFKDDGFSASQLGVSQVDFSFLDYGDTQSDYPDVHLATQVRALKGRCHHSALWPPEPPLRQYCSTRTPGMAISWSMPHMLTPAVAPASDAWARPPSRQAAGLTQGEGGAIQGLGLGLDAAFSQLSFQEQVEGAEAAEEGPAELPEWACA